jgi:CDP-paratose 2-epimerase
MQPRIKFMNKLPGITQWFRINEKELVQKAIEVVNELQIKEFRLLFSWADWESPDGPQWFNYFTSEIGRKTEARLIPSLYYTPPEIALKNSKGEAKTSHPPRDLSTYAKFADEMIMRYGKYFDWVQLWNEPNWKPYWEWDLDPDGKLYAEMAGQAADVVHAHGKKAAMGGLSPYEHEWIELMNTHGLLPKMDAIGIHYSPSWKDQRRRWYGWETELKSARSHLKGLDSERIEVWIAESGFSTVAEAEDERDRMLQIWPHIRSNDKTRK